MHISNMLAHCICINIHRVIDVIITMYENICKTI